MRKSKGSDRMQRLVAVAFWPVIHISILGFSVLYLAVASYVLNGG